MQPHDDDLPSLAVGFGSGRWGALASYGAKRFAGPEKRYGASGNRFVAMVEFGETPRAKSLLAGEQSGDPRSPHCFDQARLYTQGRFKDVVYYREGVLVRAQSIYQLGAEGVTDPEARDAKRKRPSVRRKAFLHHGVIVALMASGHLGVTVTIILV